MNVLVTLALEGWLEEAFVPAYLQAVFQANDLTFTRDSVQIPTRSGRGGKHTNLSTIQRSVIQHISGLTNHEGPGLFVFGVDCEDNLDGREFVEDSDFQQEVERVRAIFSDISSHLKSSQGICFVPVICMETWIWYLRNPEAEPGSFDRVSADELKKLVFSDTKDYKSYQKVSSSKQNSEKVIQDLVNQGKMSLGAFQNLSAQSPSFQDFHQKIEAFVASIHS